MRILIHSNSPTVPSGYGIQAKLMMQQLKAHGYRVACSCLTGLGGSPIRWDGMTLFPSGRIEYSPDVILGHSDAFRADLILTIMDLHKLLPVAGELRKRNVLSWLPVDCEPIGRLDRAALEGIQPTPLAMSRFVEKQITDAGFADCKYVPHGIDCDVYRPSADRFAFRKELAGNLGFADDAFVVGICAANNDVVRKAFPEQLRAFQRFHRKHKNSILMLHTVVGGGFPVTELIDDYGIADCAIISDQYSQVAGTMGDEMMSEWYGGLDVLLQCTFAEAFGLPTVMAQACGTPVIGSSWSATKELVPEGCGWTVKGSEFRNYVHRAWWHRPDVDDIVRKLELAWQAAGDEDRRARCREFALAYHAPRVFEEYWAPILKQAEEDL
jgi:glycosyltransferase involved in cell wall biosynthesis